MGKSRTDSSLSRNAGTLQSVFFYLDERCFCFSQGNVIACHPALNGVAQGCSADNSYQFSRNKPQIKEALSYSTLSVVAFYCGLFARRHTVEHTAAYEFLVDVGLLMEKYIVHTL